MFIFLVAVTVGDCVLKYFRSCVLKYLGVKSHNVYNTIYLQMIQPKNQPTKKTKTNKKKTKTIHTHIEKLHICIYHMYR